MRLKIYQVDAFGRGVFTGNPAAVVPLEHWLADETLGAIAEENNLAETAFIVKDGDGWELRWFTPKVEVALCGHATLGAAHAICEFIDPDAVEISFKTRYSGLLSVKREADVYEISFPKIASTECRSTEQLAKALRAQPEQLLTGNYSETEWDFIAVFGSQDDIENLEPDMGALSVLGSRGAICTAPGNDVDFVSRYFAPAAGVPEDPVTGSAHCILTPIWAARFDKRSLTARQISKRGGWLECRLDQTKVRLSGQAFTYLEGLILI